MLGAIKKWIFGLIIVAVVIFFGILGFNLYINYQTYTFKKVKEEERMKKQQEIEDREKLDKELKELQRDALEGWSPRGKGTILKAENINHLGMLEHSVMKCENCHSCEDCQQGNVCVKMEPKLIFTRQVNEYIRNVLAALTDFTDHNYLTESDGYNDNVSPYLKRYNAVLYGAPGTGKTELVNELVHHLQDQFGDPHNEIRPLRKEIIELNKELDNLRKQAKNIARKNPDEVTMEDNLIEKKVEKQRDLVKQIEEQLKKIEEQYLVPPVFKIDGAKLQTAGEAMNQPNSEQKLIKIIKYLKKDFFGNEYSDKPYIVFVEEADQGKNVMTAGKNNLLEEYKNFLSTAEDKIGLRADAQDSNSIIIIATNNFDQIDPAVTRRGRLGTRLNFNWTPALLEKYSSRGDSEWEQVNWPKNDPSWQFTGNVNYEELYVMCSKFGYSKFADQFTRKKENQNAINKANQIIQSYLQLSKNLEWKKNKERELGKFPTGNKIIEKKKIKHKNATTGKITEKEEEEEVDEKICNWILHFLYTFHKYNDKEDLDSFKTANEIQAYNFGDSYATREAIWAIYRRIGEECKVLEVNNDLLSQAGANIGTIADTMSAAYDVQNQMNEVKDVINQVKDETNRIREHMNLKVQELRNSIERVGGQNGGGMGELVKRINNLESRMNSMSSSGSSSSGGNSNTENMDKLKTLLEEIRTNLSTLSSTEVFNKLVDFWKDN